MREECKLDGMNTLDKLDASLSFQLKVIMSSGLVGEELVEEAKRSKEVNSISNQIINLYKLKLDAAKFKANTGEDPFSQDKE